VQKIFLLLPSNSRADALAKLKRCTTNNNYFVNVRPDITRFTSLTRQLQQPASRNTIQGGVAVAKTNFQLLLSTPDIAPPTKQLCKSRHVSLANTPD
jgi:hypothetical protein